MKAAVAIFVFALAFGSSISLAQSTNVDRITHDEMIAKAQDLSAQANGSDGMASVKLKQYPNHYTMMALRKKDGAVEVHQHFADVFFVVQGHAILLSGGKLIDPSSSNDGEIRGKSLQGGTREDLHPGDVVHIPATVPHQLLVSGGDTFVYYVVKVEDK